MKLIKWLLVLAAVCASIEMQEATAVVFTNDFVISPGNGTYDGQDVVVSNSVLTVDGVHNFASLRVASGATLTHSAASNGLPFVLSTTNESVLLTNVDVVTLSYAGVFAGSVVVTDTNGIVTYTNNADYLLTNVGPLTGIQRTTNSTIADGATVYVSYDSQLPTSAGLTITLTNSFELESGAVVKLDGRGYSSGFGPGPGGSAGSPLSGGGGGYGGNGGLSSSNGAGGLGYSTSFADTNLGSGGGTGAGGIGGAGGGRIQLSAGSECILNGLISADGQNATNNRAGGGSGGSIWISAATISGNGSLNVRGGAGEPIHGGGGGGGRITLDFQTNLFAGTISATGGAGWQRGGAGTILVRSNGTEGVITIDNGNLTGAGTPLNFSNPVDLILLGRAVGLTVNASTVTVGSLLVRSNCSISSLATNNVTLALTVLGNATLQAGAAITLDGKGYGPDQGPGSGENVTYASGGAGHGGYGGVGGGTTLSAKGGNIYGSLTSPSQWGSGARTPAGAFGSRGGTGGGAVRLIVNGLLHLDGMISVNGASGTVAGGGAGGSAWLSLGGISGQGMIAANGGSGLPPNAGGGGGGRIALTCDSNSFSGVLSAAGGNGSMGGGAGTIYSKLNSATFADLRIDNGGMTISTNTLLDVNPNLNLTVSGGGKLRTSLSLTLGTLAINDGALFLAGGTSPMQLTVASNALIGTGGVISGDGLGQISGSGQGAGASSTIGSSGGGHGGYGGRGLGFTNSSNPGGNINGTTASPSTPGSGGGSGVGFGGNGGAALRMTVSGSLALDGIISMNGQSASSNNAGGGSGGSLWLTINNAFSGSGRLSAEGGSGHLPNGGGGGGGRVAVYYGAKTFTGDVSAKGGSGFVNGGAGTIYQKLNSASAPDLILDNGGLSGTNTVLDLTSVSNLTVKGGAVVRSSFSSVSLGYLYISSKSTLLPPAGSGNMTLNVSGGVTIESNGRIASDGESFSTLGIGAVGSNGGSGGSGHGGYGGRGATAAGGNIYDVTATPTQGGSTGAGVGSRGGGGTIRMTVGGPMILDGIISANGGGQTNGGTSGGAIWLTLNQFSGSGSISADGGAGQLPNNGGGGGGRIAIYYNTNSFTGAFSAKGGSGYVAGGAGTIYLKRNSNFTPDVIADNGGQMGTNTAIDLTSISNLTISGGARLQQSLNSSLIVSSLVIASNSYLLPPSPLFSVLNLSISNSANIAAGGGISGDGRGNSKAVGSGGPGAGSTTLSIGTGGGGGYGGIGGKAQGSSPELGGFGGNGYGSLTSPIDLGSGGGDSSSVFGSGGAGGGVIRVTAKGTFVLNGEISGDGLTGSTNKAGGGSGGSVWLALDRLTGTGSVSADGGSGVNGGGGGGGGRISLSYNYSGSPNNPTNGFLGNVFARGGNGNQKGGAGTIYIRTNTSQIATVLVDNGGGLGAQTLVSGTASFDLTIQNGGRATSIGSPRDLFTRSNGWVIQTGLASVTRNATFENGSGINVDGFATFGTGKGVGRGGASHGGYGALNTFNNAAVYDSAVAPTLSGSSGNDPWTPFGEDPGAGGGAVHLTVGNALILNGELSADGLNSSTNGGGSGGSIWVEALTISGSGKITASGGNGTLNGGGGGGGRIALYCTNNLFTGNFTACGGGGAVSGGAGTIYLRDSLLHTAIFLDNCGQVGTNTPLSQVFGLATNITVTGGAIAEFQGTIPVFSNLVVSAGGVTGYLPDPNLYLALLGDLILTNGSTMSVDAKGSGQSIGPGAGKTLASKGSGGGHGGIGGNSASGALGGTNYDSEMFPTLRGSGGGSGSGPYLTSSVGGGAIHLAVAGTLGVDGLISASGSDGIQDDSGGGAGGSIWITAGKIRGGGALAANGGDGDLYGGGGGGAGRIAVYSPMNTFTGSVSVVGGDGASPGGAGTFFSSSVLPGLSVISQTPNGVVSNAVGQVTLVFSEAVDALSVGADDIKLYAPYGPVAPTSFALTTPTTLQITFPMQNVAGTYQLEVGPAINDLFGTPMSQVYTGSFTSVMPLLSGKVTDTNGAPVGGVVLQPNGGLIAATTDVDGNYSLNVPRDWTGTVTPTSGSFVFAPGSRSYSNIRSDVSSQDYTMLTSIAASLQISRGDTNLMLGWNGFSGVTYQVYWSTNLTSTNWYLLGGTISGTNGAMQLQIPISTEKERYFRVGSQN